MVNKPVIAAIDPGSLGAIAWFDMDGHADSVYMPASLEDMVAIIRNIEKKNFGITFYVEKVGTYMPGNSGPAAVTFARHCGHIDAILATIGVKTKYISPQQWMKPMDLSRFPKLDSLLSDKEKSKELARRKAIRKNEIKEFVSSKFPAQKITLKNADAFGLLYWAFKNDTQTELNYE